MFGEGDLTRQWYRDIIVSTSLSTENKNPRYQPERPEAEGLTRTHQVSSTSQTVTHMEPVRPCHLQRHARRKNIRSRVRERRF